LAQMTSQDFGDLERLLNIAPGEISYGGDEKTVARMRGRSRLLVNYLRQRLVRLEEGTVATVPELFPRLFEEADMVHDLQVAPDPSLPTPFFFPGAYFTESDEALTQVIGQERLVLSLNDNSIISIWLMLRGRAFWCPYKGFASLLHGDVT